MNRLVAFGLLCAAFLVVSTGELAAQKDPLKNKKNGDVVAASAQQYALLAQNYKEMVGEVQSIDGKMMTLRVEYNHPVYDTTRPPNPGANLNNQISAANWQAHYNRAVAGINSQMQRVQRDQAQLAQSKNAAQAQQRMYNLQRDYYNLQLSMYRLEVQATQHNQNMAMRQMRSVANRTHMEKDFVDFDLPIIDKSPVRKVSSGVEYDDKGNVKPQPPPTTNNMPGVPAKMDDVATGSRVKVYLSPPKGTTSASSSTKKDDDAGDVPMANRPRVRMIVLVGDDPNAMAANKKK